MSMAGVIVNGRVELGESCVFPDGTRVRIELDSPPKPNRNSAEWNREIEILRQTHQEVLSGNVRPAREVLREIAERHNFPLEPGE